MCYARFPADFVDFVGDGCSTRNTSTLEILRNTFSIDKNATQNASCVGQGSRSIKETNTKKKRWQPATVTSVSLLLWWLVFLLSCNTWYHASSEDITDEEMRCWTSTDQKYLCWKCHGGFDKGIKRLEEASHQGIQHLIKSAEHKALLCGDATVNMRDLPDTYASVDTDMNAYELMRRHDIHGLQNFHPPGLFSVCLRYSNTKLSLFIHPRTGHVMRLRILTTEFGSFQHELPLSIQWMGPKKGKGKMWLPNHFLPIAPESSDDSAAHDHEKQTEGSVCGNCDDDVLNDDGTFYEADTGVDDDHVHNDNIEIDNNRRDGEEEETIEVTSSPVVLHDGDETETDDETHDSNDLMGMCFEGKHYREIIFYQSMKS
ncbi:hypothetical protein PoB_006987900 [Plakobranchus ocellatus]|uniref:C2H2-type domain-containing protein n=1 Tax=Plakobranchus ocellatus TaxID=259542 RepID=A0AAV4DGT6_9GAST|nr:hypothetical protein PoB_006987900 [Plakobranchus ocellatus]